MIIGDGDIHIVVWMPGQPDPTQGSGTGRSEVIAADGKTIRNYRILPHVGDQGKICPECQETLTVIRKRFGQNYRFKHIQSTKQLAPPSTPFASPRYN